MLAFLIKAVVAALKRFPEFNASLDGEELVLKRYFHIGFAADTPNGLVVPVLKDADQKGVLQIAQETSALAAKAREGKLSPAEMSGGEVEGGEDVFVDAPEAVLQALRSIRDAGVRVSLADALLGRVSTEELALIVASAVKSLPDWTKAIKSAYGMK